MTQPCGLLEGPFYDGARAALRRTHLRVESTRFLLARGGTTTPLFLTVLQNIGSEDGVDYHFQRKDREGIYTLNSDSSCRRTRVSKRL